MRYQVVVVLLVVGAVLAPGDEPAPVQYEGLWERRVQSAAEVPDSVYLSIQDVGQSRYIVVSHCNYYELLSFAALRWSFWTIVSQKRSQRCTATGHPMPGGRSRSRWYPQPGIPCGIRLYRTRREDET
jgi:hypothetical protein